MRRIVKEASVNKKQSEKELKKIMSRNYDNWERLVAAVVKREQIRQLCHQDSVSTIYSSSSSHLELSHPVSLGSFGTNIFKFIRPLKKMHNNSATALVRLAQDVAMWDELYFAKGTEAVIKSLFASKITEDEFERHMSVLGSCKHENVGTPLAYHFSQATKVIVYNYYIQGSVFDMLGGGRGMTPNWENRLRIAIGAGRGVAHIHKQCGGTLAHGNIKCSNTFLNSQLYGCVSDFGLPERHKSAALPSQERDVYSFGVLLLEICTRASPMLKAKAYTPEQDMLEDRRLGVFVDEEEMDSVKTDEFQRTMEIANWCLASLPRARPSMAQVVSELEKMEPMLPPPQLSNQDSIYSQHSNISGEKKRGWNRFLQFVI